MWFVSKYIFWSFAILLGQMKFSMIHWGKEPFHTYIWDTFCAYAPQTKSYDFGVPEPMFSRGQLNVPLTKARSNNLKLWTHDSEARLNLWNDKEMFKKPVAYNEITQISPVSDANKIYLQNSHIIIHFMYINICNSMKQSPWGVNSHSISEEIPYFFMKPKFHYVLTRARHWSLLW